MAETKTETKTAENPRKAIREAREARLRVINGPPNVVKVYASSDVLRGNLRHANGTRFREDGSAEWPNDNFTKRRIAEGSVRTDGPGPSGTAEPDETLNPRQQAALNKPKKAEPKDNGKAPPPPKPQPQPST